MKINFIKEKYKQPKILNIIHLVLLSLTLDFKHGHFNCLLFLPSIWSCNLSLLWISFVFIPLLYCFFHFWWCWDAEQRIFLKIASGNSVNQLAFHFLYWILFIYVTIGACIDPSVEISSLSSLNYTEVITLLFQTIAKLVTVHARKANLNWLISSQVPSGDLPKNM